MVAKELWSVARDKKSLPVVKRARCQGTKCQGAIITGNDFLSLATDHNSIATIYFWTPDYLLYLIM